MSIFSPRKRQKGRRKQINFQNISILTIYLHENSENRGMSGEMMVGGLGSVKERDDDVDVVIAKVRQEIEAKAKVSEMLLRGCTCDFISDLFSGYPLTLCFTIFGSSE